MNERSYPNCFVCGQENPLGLKIRFEADEHQAWAYFDSPLAYEGYHGVIHGGIIATLLDEAMANIMVHQGLLAVTADMNVKYRKPLPIGQKVKVCGEITLQKSRTIHAKATLTDAAGAVYAQSTGTYIVLKRLPEN